MTKKRKDQPPKVRAGSKKWMVLLVAFLFVAFSAASVLFYTHWLEDAFLDNVQFYLNEIADHDTKSVDQEIDKQWEKLSTVGAKLSLERYEDIEDLQHFLNLEMEATGFEGLMLIDSDGQAYGANYLIEDRSGEEWMASLLTEKQPFVVQNKMKYQYVVWDNTLLYGVPIEAKIGGKEFVGIVGRYRMVSVWESLLITFFGGDGLARVVKQDGTIITTEITQKQEVLENLLEELKDGQASSGDSYESIQKKLAAGEIFSAVYSAGDEEMVLTAKPLENADWMVVVTVPVTVASSQTAVFLRITAVMLVIVCVFIGIVLFFAFVSYRRTLILRNSREIFYREKLFNLLARHTDDVFIVEDFKSRKLNFVSENVQRTLGIEPKAGVQADLANLPEDMQESLQREVKGLIARSAADGEHEHLDYEFEWTMPENGRKKWLHMALYTAVADFTQRPEPCLLIVLSDYTQIKENQRTLELAMKQAQEAAQSKSVFLSNMSHEMRTPLNGIIGCLSLMKSHQKDSDVLREYLGKADATARYLVSLVSDILDMSKIESHKLTLEEETISYREIFGNLETMFRAGIEEKGIRFKVELMEPLWTVQGDQVRIQQILINLLGNAQKFTDAGGEITLAVRQEPAGEGTVKTILSVSDTGIGMSEAFLERIWTPFEQERLDTARLHGGSGLGLAITHELVQLMNGTITVTSKEGRGSTFLVELTQQGVRPDEGHMEAPQAAGKAGWLRGRTILAAEDNELNRELLIFMLEEQHARVIAAANGQEAVEAFKQSSPGEIDAVLMDMQMPVMDGCAASRAIRALPRPDAKTVPIVACTANAFQEDIDRALAAGMDAHIAKPLDLKKLMEQLERLWEERTL